MSVEMTIVTKGPEGHVADLSTIQGVPGTKGHLRDIVAKATDRMLDTPGAGDDMDVVVEGDRRVSNVHVHVTRRPS